MPVIRILPRFNPSRGIAIIQTSSSGDDGDQESSFNPSRGIAIIQTPVHTPLRPSPFFQFQSLTRDSNHSNTLKRMCAGCFPSFNPSRGIAIIQTRRTLPTDCPRLRFNPSRGIAIIQTPSTHALSKSTGSFNPSRGIAIIQTSYTTVARSPGAVFQSLTRDSNHSNSSRAVTCLTR